MKSEGERGEERVREREREEERVREREKEREREGYFPTARVRAPHTDVATRPTEIPVIIHVWLEWFA